VAIALMIFHGGNDLGVAGHQKKGGAAGLPWTMGKAHKRQGTPSTPQSVLQAAGVF
jgi:hypothetical protein